MPKEHAMLLSVLLLFKFLFKDFIVDALTAYFIRGIVAFSATLPPSIKLFLTEEWNYKEVVSRTPHIHTAPVDFIKSLVVAPIPGFFFCVLYAAKYCLVNNVLGISSRIEGIEMLSLRSHTGATLLMCLFTYVRSYYFPTDASCKLLFPTSDATWPSFMLTIGDTVILGIVVALTLRIAVPRGSKNCFFNYTFLLYTVGMTVIIMIMNWFQTARMGQPALIGFVAVQCLWDGEIKPDIINQMMGKLWDWNLYGTKLKKSDGWVLNTANEDAKRDGGDGSEDGSSGPESSEDSDDESIPFCQRAVQVLLIRANFPICVINGYDGQQGQCIYALLKGEVQEEGMVDLVPIGPYGIFMANNVFTLKVYYYTSTAIDSPLATITKGWYVMEDDDTQEYTRTLCAGPDHKVEITYLVITNAIETDIEVRLKLKDIGSRSRAVYGKIMASVSDFGNKSVYLFSHKRWRSLSFPSGSVSILPLSSTSIAVPYRRNLKLHIEVDLTIITTYDNQEEEEKNLKFNLEFSRGINRQKIEVDGDGVEVNISCYPEL